MKIRFKLLSTPSPINVWISQSLTWVCLYRCTSKLPRSVLQPLADQMANRLPVWKGKFMHWSGRLTLIKTTLVAISMYTTISTELPPIVAQIHGEDHEGLLMAGVRNDARRHVPCGLVQGSTTSSLGWPRCYIPHLVRMSAQVTVVMAIEN
jgi:hypothetical protein